MAKNVGQLTVDLRLVSQKFEAGLKKATASLTSFRSKAQTATRAMTGMQAQVGALVGVAGFGALINNSLKTVDSLAKVSDRLGIATDRLSAMRFAAEQTGASTETLDMGLQRMVRRLGQVAATGKGEAAVALERLGISIKDIKDLSPDQQFALIAERMKDVSTQGEKVFITQKLFDSEGVKLLNTLNLGADGLSKMIDQAETLGIAVNRVDAAKIEAANDAINSAAKAVQGVGNSLTIELAPIIKEVADRFVEAASEGEGFGNKIRGVIEKSAGFIGVFADGIHGIKVIIKGVETALFGFGAAWANIMNYIVNDVITPAVNAMRENLTAPLREILEFGSSLPLVGEQAQSMLDNLNQAGQSEGIESIRNLADQMAERFRQNKDELQTLLLETIPSEAMKERIKEVFESAQIAAEEATQKARDAVKGATGQTAYEEQSKQADDLRKKEQNSEKSHLDQMATLQLGSSKKILAIQRALKLKQAIMSGFTAIQEAWASAPFPANIPAVALATASTAANVAGIRGVAHDGIDNIPREGTWLLDKGERVVDSRTNADLKNYLKGNGGNSIGSVVYSPTYGGGNSIADLEKMDARNRKRFLRQLQTTINTPV